TTRITANGNIFQSGALTGSGTGTLAITSFGGSIILPNAGNALPNTISLALTASGGNSPTIVNTTTTQFGNVSLRTPTLTVTATGSISQLAGTTIQTGGGALFTVGASNNEHT